MSRPGRIKVDLGLDLALAVLRARRDGPRPGEPGTDASSILSTRDESREARCPCLLFP